MHKYIAPMLLLVGCASSGPHDHTKAFLVEEARVVNACLAPYRALPLADKLEVNLKVGHSPFYATALCYSNQIDAVVKTTDYAHAASVKHYSEYVLSLAGARDRGQIDKPTTVAHYNQATALFRKTLVNRDDGLATMERKELFTRLSIFLGALNNQMAEQERQRLARKPTNCFVTGVYQTTGVTCM